MGIDPPCERKATTSEASSIISAVGYERGHGSKLARCSENWVAAPARRLKDLDDVIGAAPTAALSTRAEAGKGERFG